MIMTNTLVEKIKRFIFFNVKKIVKIIFDKIHLNLTFIIFIDNIFRIDKKLFYLLINFPKEIIPIISNGCYDIFKIFKRKLNLSNCKVCYESNSNIIDHSVLSRKTVLLDKLVNTKIVIKNLIYHFNKIKRIVLYCKLCKKTTFLNTEFIDTKINLNHFGKLLHKYPLTNACNNSNLFNITNMNIINVLNISLGEFVNKCENSRYFNDILLTWDVNDFSGISTCSSVDVIGIINQYKVEKEYYANIKLIFKIVGIKPGINCFKDLKLNKIIKKFGIKIEKFSRRNNLFDKLSFIIFDQIRRYQYIKKIIILLLVSIPNGRIISSNFFRTIFNIAIIADNFSRITLYSSLNDLDFDIFDLSKFKNSIRKQSIKESGHGTTISLINNILKQINNSVLLIETIYNFSYFKTVDLVDEIVFHNVTFLQHGLMIDINKFKVNHMILFDEKMKLAKIDIFQYWTSEYNCKYLNLSRFELIFKINEIKSSSNFINNTLYHIIRTYLYKSKVRVLGNKLTRQDFIKIYFRLCKHSKTGIFTRHSIDFIITLFNKYRKKFIIRNNYELFQGYLHNIIKLSASIAKVTLENIITKNKILQAFEILNYSLKNTLIYSSNKVNFKDLKYINKIEIGTKLVIKVLKQSQILSINKIILCLNRVGLTTNLINMIFMRLVKLKKVIILGNFVRQNI